MSASERDDAYMTRIGGKRTTHIGTNCVRHVTLKTLLGDRSGGGKHAMAAWHLAGVARFSSCIVVLQLGGLTGYKCWVFCGLRKCVRMRPLPHTHTHSRAIAHARTHAHTRIQRSAVVVYTGTHMHIHAGAMVVLLCLLVGRDRAVPTHQQSKYACASTRMRVRVRAYAHACKQTHICVRALAHAMHDMHVCLRAGMHACAYTILAQAVFCLEESTAQHGAAASRRCHEHDLYQQLS